MSDQGGTSEAGWQPDPHGRHEYRYWDGTTWTDQVSDGGIVSTDPPGDVPTAATSPPAPGVAAGPPGAPPYVDQTEKPKSKVPVGILALVGLGVAAVVAALVIFLGGDDDGGGTGDFAGTVSEDEPFFVRTFDLEAGEGIRARVEPDDDLDTALTLAVSRELAESEIFGFEGDDDELLEYYGFGYDQLFSDALESDLSSDLSDALSDDFSDFEEQLGEDVPSLVGAGLPIDTLNDNGEGELEGSIFMAPIAGEYSVIVSGVDSEGDFDGAIETTGPDEDFEAFEDDEEFDAERYYEGIDPLRGFLCDEDFWGESPEDISDNLSDICDDDNFDALLSDDFTSDFSDDFTSDFSDDFTSDFSDDFTSDFSDDFGDELFIGEIAVGESADGFISPNGANVYSIVGEGSLVVIDVFGTFATGGLDPTVAVRDSSGVAIGSDDDGGDGDRDSRLEIRLDAGETYEIVVAGFSDYSGDYELVVS